MQIQDQSEKPWFGTKIVFVRFQSISSTGDVRHVALSGVQVIYATMRRIIFNVLNFSAIIILLRHGPDDRRPQGLSPLAGLLRKISIRFLLARFGPRNVNANGVLGGLAGPMTQATVVRQPARATYHAAAAGKARSSKQPVTVGRINRGMIRRTVQ